MNLKVLFSYFFMLLFLCFPLFMGSSTGFAEEQSTQKTSGALIKLDGEILEIEELKDPIGAAIYTVKDLSSGETLRLFAHPYRSLIQTGDSAAGPSDVLGGSKVTIIYKQTAERDIPEIVFAKVTNSFYT